MDQEPFELFRFEPTTDSSNAYWFHVQALVMLQNKVFEWYQEAPSPGNAPPAIPLPPPLEQYLYSLTLITILVDFMAWNHINGKPVRKHIMDGHVRSTGESLLEALEETHQFFQTLCSSDSLLQQHVNLSPKEARAIFEASRAQWDKALRPESAFLLTFP